MNKEEEPLPQPYNGCTCDCHRFPGVKHIMACCPRRQVYDEVEPDIDFTDEEPF